MIRIKQVRCTAISREKTNDKFLTNCYVLFSSNGVCYPRHVSFTRALYAQGMGHLFRRFFNTGLGDSRMDDYQEELLEYQAFELDPLEPAEDATEL
ncbi:hypothetical protein [Pseudomonas sp. R37(2017)]|nr:hypothetical protein [Pseudomonas sp. R37(2017)]